MKNKLLMMALVVIMLPQLKCSSGSSTAEVQEQPSAVQITHNVPPEVTLLELPFVAEFIMEITGVGDIGYHAIQASEPKTTFLPSGITYQELSVLLDLKDKTSNLLVVAANNAGEISRVNLDVYLNTNCPSCDLSYDGEGSNGVYLGIDFSYADLTGASFKGQHLSENNFSYANLVGIDFTEATLHGAVFIGADLYQAIFPDWGCPRCEWGNTTCPDGTNSDDNPDGCIGHL